MVKNIKFPALPSIYMYIEADYNKAESLGDMVQLHFDWLKESERSNNEVRREAYLKSAHAIYTEITGRSYDTNKFKIETMSEKDNVIDLRNRVEKCRDRLSELKIKSARFYFAKKYPEYEPKDDTDQYRLENLWFGKSTDLDFTKKLESFTKYKEVEFK